MLNKELLMTGEKGSIKVRLTIGKGKYEISRQDSYGFARDDVVRFGMLNVMPCWGDVHISRFIYNPEADATAFVLTGYSNVRAYVEGYARPIYNVVLMGDVYELSDPDALGTFKYLTFDPPPRRVLGSHHAPTDLGRGYYVEEVPWEAQDAEQGASDDDEWGSGWRTYLKVFHIRHGHFVDPTTKCIHKGGIVLRQGVQHLEHQNNSCAYRRSATLRERSLSQSERLQHGGFGFQRRYIYNIRKPCVGKNRANSELNTLDGGSLC